MLGKSGRRFVDSEGVGMCASSLADGLDCYEAYSLASS